MLWGLATSGAIGGVLLLLVGSDRTTVSREFVDSPGFILWAAVIAAQTAFWTVMAGPVWIDVRAIYREYNLHGVCGPFRS